MKDNPYSLYYDKLISFRAADKLNHKLKNPAGNDERFAAGLVASLRYDSESNGNLFVPYDKLKEILETFLNSQGSGFPKSSVPDQRLHDVLSELIRARIIETDPVPFSQNPSVYLRENHWAETQIVKTIKTLESNIFPIKRARSMRFSSNINREISHWLQNRGMPSRRLSQAISASSLADREQGRPRL